MAEFTIKVTDAGKKFCKSLKRSMWYGMGDITQNAFGMMPDSSRLRKDEFWALDNVSFELKRGETLGIIGPNGAGKTTLLKMLNGIFMPDKGRIEMNGRVGALIQVGAGFHPMLTGRENIYVNGSILGMSKAEIDKKIDFIIDFADIGDFLDSPVKYYSSGMYVRLGFAIAVHCEPDILLIDEILAVGDIKFQSKCFNYMTTHVLNRGCSVVFVSHNRYAVQDLCQRALYINHGKMIDLGETMAVTNHYLKDMQGEEATHNEGKSEYSLEEGVGGLTKILFMDKKGNVANQFRPGEAVKIRFYYHFEKEVKSPSVGVVLHHSDYRYSVVSSTDYIFNLHSGYDGFKIPSLKGTGYFEVNMDHLYLPVGCYKILTYLFLDNNMNLVQKNENAGTVEMLWADQSPERSLIELPHNWIVEKAKG
ncbi:Teichoic acid export ATP-binding protein TagH [hydrothermal vent metagenome]|uniref:Teichoic acid export ATP-binding protein TagH n=1 Tax=hydrothermal vent metagenome TaxID=652676 RepID=A0A3B0WXK4_9ZZZZ